jgi:hypothetical protein
MFKEAADAVSTGTDTREHSREKFRAIVIHLRLVFIGDSFCVAAIVVGRTIGEPGAPIEVDWNDLILSMVSSYDLNSSNPSFLWGVLFSTAWRIT